MPEPKSPSVHLPPRIDAPFGGCMHPQRVPYGLVEKHKLVRTESLFENENNGVGGCDTGSQEGRTWSLTDGTHFQYPKPGHPPRHRESDRERARERETERERQTHTNGRLANTDPSAHLHVESCDR